MRLSSKDRQRVEMVASIISENGITPERARQLNDDEGWTYEIRWEHEDYVDDYSFTRVENDVLEEHLLELAIQKAQERGIMYPSWTVREVARYLKVTEGAVRDWIRSGELPAVDLGGRAGYRILEPDLLKFIQERKTK